MFASIAIAMLGVSVPATLAAEHRSTGRGKVTELEMRVSTSGVSYQEYLERQDRLNARLASEMPAASMASPLRAEVTPEEIDSVMQAPARGGVPLTIGLVKPATPRLDVDGLALGPASAAPHRAGAARAVRAVPTMDGGFVWARSVVAPQGGALRLHIENLSLPSGAAIYFYSPAGEAFGPYTGSGPGGDGDLWTDTLEGSEGILQVRLDGPARESDLHDVVFSVTEVGVILPRFSGSPQAAAGFCGNPSCVLDVSCASVDPNAAPAELAVAKYEWTQGAYIYTCSGGLIADTNPTQGNYFLTANHCISKSNTAKNAQFYFRFATTSCNGACPVNSGWPYKTTGATVAASGRKGDFTLLQLSADPPAGSVFLGWSSVAVANSSGAALRRISNPNFGPQVYSEHSVDTSIGTCSSWPRGERIYSRDTLGAIDGGSSGSPILNSGGKIVGQLSGTCGSNPSDACASGPGEANATVDGAFAFYFASVQPFLAP